MLNVSTLGFPVFFSVRAIHSETYNYEQTADGWEFVKFSNPGELKTLTIQGELCAPGIQKNRLKLRSPQWFVFTVIENGKRVDIGRMLTICNTLDLQHVPIEEIGQNLPVVYPTVEDILKRAEGEYPNGGKKEGIVVRPTTPVQSSFLGDYLSFKAINNQFLLKG